MPLANIICEYIQVATKLNKHNVIMSVCRLVTNINIYNANRNKWTTPTKAFTDPLRKPELWRAMSYYNAHCSASSRHQKTNQALIYILSSDQKSKGLTPQQTITRTACPHLIKPKAQLNFVCWLLGKRNETTDRSF
jgi:hypothetical protein